MRLLISKIYYICIIPIVVNRALFMIDKKRFTFTKEERITGKVRIEKIFATGKSFLIYPFRVVFVANENSSSTHSVLISVPKKRLKRAVARNRVKRLFKEAYRLNKDLISSDESNNAYSLEIVFVYVADAVLPYDTIEKSITRSLQKINTIIRQS